MRGGGCAVGVAFVAGRARSSARWVGGQPATCRRRIAAPDEIRQLVDHDFADYYSSNPAGSFAAQVWTNNAWVAALASRSAVCSACRSS